MRPPLAAKAVVVGTGIAGLAVARVLSDSFERVDIFDRDEIAEAPGPRAGLPQGNHPHGLLMGGLQKLQRRMPGVGEELVATGALELELGKDTVVYSAKSQKRLETAQRDASGRPVGEG